MTGVRANAAAYCAGEDIAEPERLLRVLAPARAAAFSGDHGLLAVHNS